MPCLCELYPGICLTTEEKAWKNFRQDSQRVPDGMIYRSFATTVSQFKTCDFSGETFLKVLKCYNFLWVQRQHKCSLAASFANCVMTLYLLKVHLQTFLSIPITQKCQISSCDTVVTDERYVGLKCVTLLIWMTDKERCGAWVGPESRCQLHHIFP